MSKEDRFWFGKAGFRVLEGKDGVREAYDCMAGGYDFSECLYWTREMEEAEGLHGNALHHNLLLF